MSKHGKFQTTFEYAVTRALIGGLGLLPRPAAVATGRAAGRIAHKFAGGLRRTGETNLKLAFPDMHARERAAMLRSSFDNLGRLLGEFSQFPRATPESLRELVEYDEVGLSYLRAAEGQGRGVIFLTGHLGAWEFLSFAWSALEYPISFLVRPIDNARVEDLIEGIRTRFGNTAINKKMAARQALRVLRDGGTLGILADLNTHPNEGIFVPFFGHLACTTSGVATLALRTNSLVIPTCAVWDEKRRRFFFHGDPPVELVRTGDDKRDIEINTANFAAAIEHMIRAYPEQWLWIHKRWRTRPPGEPDFYARETQFDTKEPQLASPTSTNSLSKP
jgi:KDO2-lipid IV(A) lauroyltransferase